MSRSSKNDSRRSKARIDAARHNANVPAVSIPSNRRNWLLGFILVAATILAYQRVWHAGFIWDDDIYVTLNPLLTAPDGLRRIWFSLDSPSQYFPLAYTTFLFEHALWGLNPAGYHWVNLLLHALNALLVWRLLRALEVPGAWLAAALFALHPVQVESVAWISERKNVLMGFFFLLALLFWTRFLAKESKARWRDYAVALFFFALALFSKTTACTMPAALLLILWLIRKPIGLARLLQVLPFLLLGLVMGLVSIWWERHHQGTQGQLFAVPFSDRILVASRAVWFYLSKLVWPANLAFSYPRWSISAAHPLDYAWIFVCAVTVALVVVLRRWTGRSVEVALLFFVATLSPVLGLIMLYTFRYSWVADHYQYLASVGPFALAAAGFTIVTERFGNRNLLAFGLGAALLLSLGLRTWRQGAVYLNEETLWRATIESNPGSWMAQNNLGIRLVEAGRIDEAMSHYTQALLLNPEYAEAHYNLGNAFIRLGRLDEARGSYMQAIAIYPEFPAAQTNLAETLARMGQSKESIEHFAIAADMNPKKAVVQSRLGILLAENGRAEEALSHLRTVTELEPANAEAHYNLATVFAQVGRREEAIRRYREAIRLRNDYAAAHLNLANALAETERFDDAIAEYTSALELKPNNSIAHKNLATVLRRLGRAEEAAAHLEQAGKN